jgi:hypothetical protein
MVSEAQKGLEKEVPFVVDSPTRVDNKGKEECALGSSMRIIQLMFLFGSCL